MGLVILILYILEETMNKKLKVATTQFNHKAGDKEYNLSIIETMTKKASKEGVQIICFPEMCITGYWNVRKLSRLEIEKLSEDGLTGSSVLKLKELSVKYNIIIGAGIIEKTEEGNLYNSYVVTQPDRETKLHRKLHCFISEFMDSGDSYTVIETSHGIKIGILICWDNNLIENVRITALLGADILLSPHQTGGCKNRSNRVLGEIDQKIWENRDINPGAVLKEFQSIKGREWLLRWLPSRAHDNGIFIMFSNGVGRDDDEIRTGNAMLINCDGEIIEESESIKDDIVIGEFNMNLLEDSLGRNWIKGRRPELYGEIIKIKEDKKDIRLLKSME